MAKYQEKFAAQDGTDKQTDLDMTPKMANGGKKRERKVKGEMIKSHTNKSRTYNRELKTVFGKKKSHGEILRERRHKRKTIGTKNSKKVDSNKS